MYILLAQGPQWGGENSFCVKNLDWVQFLSLTNHCCGDTRVQRGPPAHFCGGERSELCALNHNDSASIRTTQNGRSAIPQWKSGSGKSKTAGFHFSYVPNSQVLDLRGSQQSLVCHLNFKHKRPTESKRLYVVIHSAMLCFADVAADRTSQSLPPGNNSPSKEEMQVKSLL